MKLAQYLIDNDITFNEFAGSIGVANGTVVHRYASGKRIPEPAVMARIVEATNGQVQPNDFYDVPDTPPGPLQAPLVEEKRDGEGPEEEQGPGDRRGEAAEEVAA
jgi:hypothetical protein